MPAKSLTTCFMAWNQTTTKMFQTYTVRRTTWTKTIQISAKQKRSKICPNIFLHLKGSRACRQRQSSALREDRRSRSRRCRAQECASRGASPWSFSGRPSRCCPPMPSPRSWVVVYIYSLVIIVNKATYTYAYYHIYISYIISIRKNSILLSNLFAKK